MYLLGKKFLIIQRMFSDHEVTISNGSSILKKTQAWILCFCSAHASLHLLWRLSCAMRYASNRTRHFCLQKVNAFSVLSKELGSALARRISSTVKGCLHSNTREAHVESRLQAQHWQTLKVLNATVMKNFEMWAIRK